MVAHRPLSSAMISNSDSDWPVHSLINEIFCSQPEVAIDVILGMALDYISADVRVNLVHLGQTVLEF